MPRASLTSPSPYLPLALPEVLLYLVAPNRTLSPDVSVFGLLRTSLQLLPLLAPPNSFGLSEHSGTDVPFQDMFGAPSGNQAKSTPVLVACDGQHAIQFRSAFQCPEKTRSAVMLFTCNSLPAPKFASILG